MTHLHDEFNKKRTIFQGKCPTDCGRNYPVKATLSQNKGETDIHCGCGCKFTIRWERVIP